MKKPLVLAAALVLAATPAAAQQRAQALPQAPTARVEQQAATATTRPTVHVTQDEIRAQVAANEAARSGEQIGSQSFWYLVAAIALGVIIATLLLD